jgi:hypothetical protein
MRTMYRKAKSHKVARKRQHSMFRVKRMKRIFNALFHKNNEMPINMISAR